MVFKNAQGMFLAPRFYRKAVSLISIGDKGEAPTSMLTWYLFDAGVACFAQLLKLRPEACWLLLNRWACGYICERFRFESHPGEVATCHKNSQVL